MATDKPLWIEQKYLHEIKVLQKLHFDEQYSSDLEAYNVFDHLEVVLYYHPSKRISDFYLKHKLTDVLLTLSFLVTDGHTLCMCVYEIEDCVYV